MGTKKYNLGEVIFKDNELLNKIYPVGSLFFSTQNINSIALLGGKWESYTDAALPTNIHAWERIL